MTEQIIFYDSTYLQRLHRYDPITKTWKLRAIGYITLLQNTISGKIRVEMHENKTKKPRMNHYINPNFPITVYKPDDADSCDDDITETDNVFTWCGSEYEMNAYDQPILDKIIVNKFKIYFKTSKKANDFFAKYNESIKVTKLLANNLEIGDIKKYLLATEKDTIEKETNSDDFYN